MTGFASFVIAPTLRPTLGEHRRAPFVSDGLDLTRIECHLGADAPVTKVEPSPSCRGSRGRGSSTRPLESLVVSQEESLFRSDTARHRIFVVTARGADAAL